MHDVYLGLGANLGDREKQLSNALEQLAAHDCIEVVGISPFIETQAESPYPQPNYINGVVHIHTILTPEELLTETQAIEQRAGKRKKGSGDPRYLDIDLLLYDDQVFSSDELIIPHPLMHERLFVLEPLRQLAPDFRHPVLGESISALYDRMIGY